MTAQILIFPGSRPRYLEEPAPEPEVKFWACSCNGGLWLLVAGGACLCPKCNKKSQSVTWAVTEVRFDDGA
jgi:hypothetical protein